MARVAVDPVTRVGGHLRLELEVRNGAVEDAWIAATMYRGMEGILGGRDPRDVPLVAQRVCGMCGGSHALAAVRAVEDALGIRPPRNARLIRNLIAGAEFVLDHAVSFYHLGLFDWADMSAAATADPAATAALASRTSGWANATPAHFRAVRDRLAGALASDLSGLVANGPWGHAAYDLSPEASLLLYAHYLDALTFQQSFSRLFNMLGGKNPHPQTWIVGGMTLAPKWGGPSVSPRTHPGLVDRNAPSPLTEAGLALLAERIAEARTFVDQVYMPDALLLAEAYPAWWSVGAGGRRLLAYGEFPLDDGRDPELLLPGGLVTIDEGIDLDRLDSLRVEEAVAHAHYAEDEGRGPRRPWEGRTDPRYGGPPLPYETLEGAERYTWVKAASYDGLPAETGPAARVLIADATGVATVRPRLDAALRSLGVRRQDVPSTMGRTVARAIEAQAIVYELETWREELRDNLARGDLAVANITRWDPGTWGSPVEGRSLGESPRGAVGHWVRIRDRRIDHYQLVDGSTWNASPRDGDGVRGPIEEALVGVRVEDRDQPLEALRVLRSFDPCAACAVHAVPTPGASA